VQPEHITAAVGDGFREGGVDLCMIENGDDSRGRILLRARFGVPDRCDTNDRHYRQDSQTNFRHCGQPPP
jgi:hypothetical protein